MLLERDDLELERDLERDLELERSLERLFSRLLEMGLYPAGLKRS